ncbi:hypothetical protein BKA93DRAFT_166288 [Sparassis latifolia]
MEDESSVRILAGRGRIRVLRRHRGPQASSLRPRAACARPLPHESSASPTLTRTRAVLIFGAALVFFEFVFLPPFLKPNSCRGECDRTRERRSVRVLRFWHSAARINAVGGACASAGRPLDESRLHATRYALAVLFSESEFVPRATGCRWVRRPSAPPFDNARPNKYHTGMVVYGPAS